MPKALNRKRDDCRNAVYVGRPTKWGNPFTHLPGKTRAEFRVATREEAVMRYEEYLKSCPDLMAALAELKGRDLSCWCAPLPCHADVLLRLANSQKGEGP